MPELREESSTAEENPFAFEDREGFRETFLMHFTRPGDAEVLRRFGVMLFDAALESARLWPDWPESATRAELRAAAADLRHLAEFLAALGLSRELSALTSADERLSRFAGRQAKQVVRIAERIETKLATSAPAEEA